MLHRCEIAPTPAARPGPLACRRLAAAPRCRLALCYLTGMRTKRNDPGKAPTGHRTQTWTRDRIWPGILLASAVTALSCKEEPSSEPAPPPRLAAGSALATGTPARAATTPRTSAELPTADSTSSIPSDDDSAPVELPPPPRPPELRPADEQANAGKILAGYGFPAHQSLTPLCGWRHFEPGGTTVVVDLFTSPMPAPQLREDYIRRLGEQGLQGDTWSIPAAGTFERQLSLQPVTALPRYPRCAKRAPDGAQTLVAARRTR